MTTQRFFALVAVLLIGASSAGAQTVALTFQNGRVRLTAENASVAQILAEWARRGHTTIVNGERVPGPPVTLELNDVSEAQALDVLLRSASGYLVAARETALADASAFDRVFILPTSSQPTSSTALPPPVASSRPIDELDEEDDPGQPVPGIRVGAQPGARLPREPGAAGVNGRPPQPFTELDEPDQPENTPAPAPGNPFIGVAPGTSRPGVISPGPPATRPREP
ncbi:MAG TPA: hypothetical protein VI485_01625 [Vicinamibacterales bacterium]|nr:hypothetical protein [Vicinamibacterales bacterium]